jgi:hypothetical protein
LRSAYPSFDSKLIVIANEGVVLAVVEEMADPDLAVPHLGQFS